MRLSELNNGDEITFEVLIGNNPYEFKCTVIDNAGGNSIFTTPIRTNGKVVSLASGSITVNVIFSRKDKMPVVWRRVSAVIDTHKKNTVYRVSSVTLGMEENRRSAFRLYLGLPAVAQIGANKKAVDVILKDLSEAGFSIISKENLDDFEGNLTRIVFNDDNKSFSIVGIIIRKVPYDDDRFLYGCRLNQKTMSLSRYINERQRRQIAMQKEISLQAGRTPKGFGDLRKQSEEDAKESRIRALTEEDKKISLDRYENVNLKSTGKKINYNRYKGLNLK